MILPSYKRNLQCFDYCSCSTEIGIVGMSKRKVGYLRSVNILRSLVTRKVYFHHVARLVNRRAWTNRRFKRV